MKASHPDIKTLRFILCVRTFQSQWLIKSNYNLINLVVTTVAIITFFAHYHKAVGWEINKRCKWLQRWTTHAEKRSHFPYAEPWTASETGRWFLCCPLWWRWCVFRSPALCSSMVCWFHDPAVSMTTGIIIIITIIIVSAYRYIAITTLAIIAVFLVYLRQFLIDLHQIYSHSSVPKTRLPEFFQLLSSSGFRARRRRDFFCHLCLSRSSESLDWLALA